VEFSQSSLESPTIVTSKKEGEGTAKPIDGSPAPTMAANKRRKSLYNGRCKPGGDILNPVAIQNAYYICHNVQDCLFVRGFKWPGDIKGKKGGKK